MNSLFVIASFSLLQPEPLQMTTDMVKFAVITGLILLVFIVGIFFALKALGNDKKRSVVSEVRSEFEKSKDGLLLVAHQKTAIKKKDKPEDNEASRETRETELLKENVDPARVFGQTCPLSNLEMADDQELVIDPYTGQGYHFSSFLNDWPAEAKRPKYAYRYPQGTVVKSDDLLTGF